MEPTLTDVEVRVIGSLIEKQITTPEYYPLTLNALTHACNQIQNREPVVSYDEKTVARALESLRVKYFAHVLYARDNRVEKYRQVLTEKLELAAPEIAALCVLMLRGPQTVGEIRNRSNRLHEFQELTDVEEALSSLAEREMPLVARLARQPGQKEARYAHLLMGDLVAEEMPTAARPEPRVEPRVDEAMLEVRGENERIKILEREVEMLKEQVAALTAQFDEFKKQFE
ncbi:MAG: YceH family protein [Pyrinomonadaceae bacterium]